MSNQDWLSLTEIARRWSDETGECPEVLERDLDTWFAGFVARDPSQQLVSPESNDGNTNRLMGLLGARYLERATFEAYCEERGYPKPCFWSGGRDDDSWRDKPSQPEPAQSSPDATPPQFNEEPSDGRYTYDPKLAAFQTQMASLSERLEADRIETTTFRKRSAADQQNHESHRGRTGALPEPDQQELIERAATASAEASDLKAQLLAAEQQIADLSAKIETRRVSAVARPSVLGPEAPSNDPMTGQGPEPRSLASYSDPHATSQLLRQTTPRRKIRGRVALVAGSTTLLVALFLWGGQTVTQLVSTQAIPPPTLVTPAQQTQPEMALQPLEPVTGKLGIGGEDLQQPDAPWASKVAALGKQLNAAKQRFADLELEAQNAKAEAKALAAELAETWRLRQTASAHAAFLDQGLDTAQQRIADLEAEAVTAQAEAANLVSELAATRQLYSAALQEAATEAEAHQKELAAAQERIAALDAQVATAEQMIAALDAGIEAVSAESAILLKELKGAPP